MLTLHTARRRSGAEPDRPGAGVSAIERGILLAIFSYEQAERVREAAQKAGSLIGYDDDNPIEGDSRTATLSIGYADGLARFDNVGEAESAVGARRQRALCVWLR